MDEAIALLVEVLLFPACAGVAGILTMLLAEYVLYNAAQKHSFTFEAGHYNFRAAEWPHIIRGWHRGHEVTITYSLGHYWSDAKNRGISTIGYNVPPHPGFHFTVTPRGLLERKTHRSGDRDFDNWVTIRGGTRAFVELLLGDPTLRKRLKDTISPTFAFTSTLGMTRAGPILLRHKSVFLTQARLEKDMDLLGDIAVLLESCLKSNRPSLPPNNSLKLTRRARP